ncbi:MAG: MetQ/NlpA family ABC transporter substrate-binding protein [Bacilli bacterium]|nr:MetQ/NlpA family ABC transporter substrate-binding protein [Bacilli bacterium]
MQKPFNEFFFDELIPALLETFKMVGIAGLISTILGILIGIVLFIFHPTRGLIKNKYVYPIVSFLTNCIRSIPFLILGVLLIPLTMFITGIFTRPTFFGSDASIIPLTIASTAFIAKLVENSFVEVNEDIIEAGKSLGMSKWQIISKILIKEALPSICNGVCVALVSLLGISAVVDSWAGGGLGGLAVSLGIQQGRNVEMIYIVLVIIIIVQILNVLGNFMYKKLKYGETSFKKLPYLLVVILLLPLLTLFNNKETIIIGVMETPGRPILEYIEEDFEKLGYDLEIQVFSKFELGNQGLRNGSFDGNLFQHTPYLNTQNKEGDLAVACEMYYPIFGGYSKTFKVEEGQKLIDTIKDGAKITIPNDDANRTRALKLLKEEGLIDFNDKTIVTLKDISYNPKNLVIEEVDSGLIGKAVNNKTTDLGIVSNSYAAISNLDGNSLVTMESLEKQKENVNIFVVRKTDLNKKWVKDLVDILISDKTSEFIKDYFNGTLLPIPESKL